MVAVAEGGRGPDDRVRFVTWAAGPRATAAGAPGGAPWPGQLPPPSPARVAPAGRPLPAELVDAGGAAVGVSGRGMVTARPPGCRWPEGRGPRSPGGRAVAVRRAVVVRAGRRRPACR